MSEGKPAKPKLATGRRPVTWPRWIDALAGLSVALVLIPQSLAYAELAGLPAFHGLYAAALAPLAAAAFASSPYLQTGPTALTSILTFGVLATSFQAGSVDIALAAALLALVVGVTRLAIGLLRLGGIAYTMSQPVLMGFTSAMAVLIIATQLPGALGAVPGGEGIGGHLLWTLSHPSSWNTLAVGLSLVTLLLVLGGRRLSPVFPGVLIAVLAGLAAGTWLGDAGPAIGALPTGFPRPSLALPWAVLPQILVGGVVIAVVGFAEVASIARTFAFEDRGRWDANREFIGQGAANLISGLFSGLPVGGSFARSSLNRIVGARTRWSGAIAGLATLAFLPFSTVLEPLPKAVLAAIVIGAVVNLLRIRPLVRLWRVSRPQFVVSWGTFLLTLALAPRIDYAVTVGIALALGVHLWRESKLDIEVERDGDVLHVKLIGVLWFVSAPHLEDSLERAVAANPGVARIVLDGNALGRVDLSGVMLLARAAESAAENSQEMEFRGLPRRTIEMLERLGVADRG